MPEYSSLQKDYAKYRIERAREDLDAARLLYDAGNYRIANNRAYYAIFHAMRAVLVFDNFDSSKHSGVIAEFRRRYIKEGKHLQFVMPRTMMTCLLQVNMIRKSR